MIRSAFTYGTLRPGEGNHRVVAGYNPASARGSISGHALFGKHRGFPYCVESDDPMDIVHGDMLTFDEDEWDDALQAMDWLEGYPAHYERAVVEVNLESGGSLKAWVYRPGNWMSGESLGDRIESGDWFDRF